MESIICYCLKCKAKLGTFNNVWNGIGSTYFSPVHPVLSSNGLVATGHVHQAAPGSQVENSVLQDLACKKCRELLGLRCDSAPKVHLLQKNQFLLRLSLMSLVSEKTGEKIRPSVLKTFPLTLAGAKKTPLIRRAATVQPSIPQTHTFRDEPGRSKSIVPSGNGTLLSVLEEESQKDLTKFRSWAKDAIEDQQKEIDRMHGAVQRIERELTSFKDFMQEIRSELASSRDSRQISNETNFAMTMDNMQSLRAEAQENEKKVKRQAKETESVKEDLRSLKAPLQELVHLTKHNPQLQQNARDIKNVKDDLKSLKTSIQKMHDVTTNLPQLHHKITEIDGVKDEIKALQRGLEELGELAEGGPEIRKTSRQIATIKEVLHLLNKRIEEEVEARQGCVAALNTSISAVVTTQPTREEARQRRHIFVEIKPTEQRLGRSAVSAEVRYASPDPETPLLGSNPQQEFPAATESGKSAATISTLGTSKWRYTGPDTRQAIWSACTALGMSSKRRSNRDCIRLLEDYVNRTSQQNTPRAKEYGQTVLVGEHQHPKLTVPHKRPDGGAEDAGKGEDIQYESPTKRRRISGRSAVQPCLAIQSPISAGAQSRMRQKGQVNNQVRLECSPVLGDYDSFNSTVTAPVDSSAASQPTTAPEPLLLAKRRSGRSPKRRFQVVSATIPLPVVCTTPDKAPQNSNSGHYSTNNSFPASSSSFPASHVSDSQTVPSLTQPNINDEVQEE